MFLTCGRLPALLPLQHSFSSPSGKAPNARRALILLGLATALLALFDYDEHVNDVTKASSFAHAFHHLFSHYGMSDHKVGVCSLVAFGCMDYQCKKGDRRTLTGSSIASNIVIAAVSALVLVVNQFRDAEIQHSLIQNGYLVLAGCVSSLFLFPSSLDGQGLRQVGFHSFRFICGLGLVAFWQIHFLTGRGPHPITPAAIASFALLALAIHHIARGNARTVEILEKYQSMYYPDALVDSFEHSRTSSSTLAAVWRAVRSGFRTVTQHADSRQIFYFLCLNLSFMVVEMLYGMWTNSLGLISDGFHMLFDCTALILGLCASIISRRPPNKTYTYGYGRVDLLSAYINGLFLFIVGIFVLIEALSRLFNPPDIISDKLLTVSVAGLLVNLVGVFLFGHLHHGCGGCNHPNHGHPGHENPVPSLNIPTG